MRLLKPIARLLQTGDPATTVDRLFNSQHVKDLQLIIAVGFLAVLLVFGIGLFLSVEVQLASNWEDIAHRANNWIFLRLAFAAAGNFLAYFGPVLAVFGAVLAWAYQVGSARLGVVDLFACEISTLCRIVTIVDTVRLYVNQFDRGPLVAPEGTGERHQSAYQFTSQESYFPVFEGNTRDLQTLEARVVINITAFYTFMKAVRDSLRKMAEISLHPTHSGLSDKAPATDSWHEAVRGVIYMLYLGLESARHAIGDLVEFEPEKAERTIVILISELEAYRFLCKQFTEEQDVHRQRLMLRVPEYRRTVPQLCRSVEAGVVREKAIGTGTGPDELQQALQWEPSLRLLRELRERYDAAMAGMGPGNT